MAAGDLERTKHAITRKYLGRAGIHAVGASRSRGAVTVYVVSGDAPPLVNLLPAIRKDAAPFEIVVVEDSPASAR
jgi:hypothetical protein